jgi:hypothetical protein
MRGLRVLAEALGSLPSGLQQTSECAAAEPIQASATATSHECR